MCCNSSTYAIVCCVQNFLLTFVVVPTFIAVFWDYLPKIILILLIMILTSCLSNIAISIAFNCCFSCKYSNYEKKHIIRVIIISKIYLFIAIFNLIFSIAIQIILSINKSRYYSDMRTEERLKKNLAGPGYTLLFISSSLNEISCLTGLFIWYKIKKENPPITDIYTIKLKEREPIRQQPNQFVNRATVNGNFSNQNLQYPAIIILNPGGANQQNLNQQISQITNNLKNINNPNFEVIYPSQRVVLNDGLTNINKIRHEEIGLNKIQDQIDLRNFNYPNSSDKLRGDD